MGGAQRFRTDIQGLRGIAVLLVVVYHAGVSVIPGGFVGVDVFFVISGFLITSHLVSAAGADDGLRLREFYARRARRLLPAAWTVLAVSVGAALIWLPPISKPQAMAEAAATALYVPNVLFAKDGTDYLSSDAPSIFQHYWSLGVEEQFYLVWPLFILVALSLARRHQVILPILVAAATLASFLLGWWATGWRQPWAFFLLPTRAWELGVGAIVAIVILRDRYPGRKSEAWRGPVAWLGVAGIVAAAVLLSADYAYPGYAAILPTVATAMVIFAGASARAFGPGRVLAARPLQFVGKISYSLYLVHWPLVVIPQSARGWDDSLPLSVTVLLSAAGIPLAWALWRFVEEPGRTGGRPWMRMPSRVLTVAAVGTALLAASALAAGNVTRDVELSTASVAPAARIAAAPSGTDTVPENLRPDLWQASDDIPEIYGNGCHRSFESTDPTGCVTGEGDAPRVAVFGDSHAGNWVPALDKLADEGLITLATHTKSSCPSVTVPQELYPGVPYTACETWRERVIEQFRADPPALIILSNYVATQVPDEPEEWSRELASTIADLPRESQVVVFADIPSEVRDPLVCLSQNLDEAGACARPRAEAVDDVASGVDDAGADKAGVPYIDFTDYLCNAEACPLVIGDVLVMRDNHHFTRTFSEEMSGVVWEAISPYVSAGE